jgi:surface polysaccharide O-acyltransferase-like enzyme
MVKEYKYWPSGDIIRLSGTFAVLMIHLTQYSIRNTSGFDVNWWSINMIQGLSIWAAPVFVMLSGTLLLSPQCLDESPLIFYQKRLSRIGVPLLFWGVVYLILEKRWNSQASWELLLTNVVHGDISWHLYYLFVILGLYVVTPGIGWFLKRLSSREELILIVLIFCFTLLTDIVNFFFIQWQWNIAMRWIPYLGYYLAGRYIVNRVFTNVLVFVIIFLLCTLVSTLGRYIEIILSSQTITYFYSNRYTNIINAPLAMSVFVLIVYSTCSIAENSIFIKICRLLAPTTFGIYLIHVLVIRETHFSFNIPYPTHIFTTLLDTLVLALVSSLLVYIIGSVPVLRSIVGCNTQKVLSVGNTTS